MSKAAASRVARALREMQQNASAASETGKAVFGTVLGIEPWTVELHGSATTLTEDDLTISRWVEQYHHWSGVEVDDTVVLAEMDDGDYVVVDVVTDDPPFNIDAPDLSFPLDAFRPSSTDDVLRIRNGEVGQYNFRWTIDARGFMTWGPGDFNMDVMLKRSDVGVLSIRNWQDDEYADLRLRALYARPATSGASGLDVRYGSDTDFRFTVDGTGTLWWGDGASVTQAILKVDALGALAIRDGSDAAYGTLRVATPVGDNDAVPKSYVTGLVGSYVPYTGATSNVNLGANTLTVNGTATATAISSTITSNTHGVIFNRTANNPINGNVLLVTAQDVGTDANPLDTTVGISGYETGKGTVKITHHKPVAFVTGSDANASAVSLLLKGTGTAAQGIFLDTEDGGTTGKLLNLRQLSSDRLVLTADGQLQLAAQGSTAGITMGTDTVLYRSAADTIRTDDQIYVYRSLTTAVAYTATQQNSGGAHFVIYADGKHEWGPGAAGRDTNLYRSAAGVLQTDGTFNVSAGTYSVTLYGQGSGILTVNPAGNAVLRNYLASGDTKAALTILGDGRIQWGTGGSTNNPDVILKRESSGVLAVRNAADNAYATLKANFVPGTAYDWTTAGTAGNRSFNSDSMTVGEIAQELKSLVDDLISLGILS